MRRYGSQPRHKFGAVQTIRDGIKFPSKLEAKVYDRLILQQKAGEVLGFFRQVPLWLGGGVTYRMDFLVFYADGSCKGVEAKGYSTPEWKIKEKLVRAQYPWFELEVVKK